MALYQLFETPNAKYVFDAAASKLLKIGEKTYRFIKNENLTGEDKPEELIRLEMQGCLTEKSPVEQFRHPYMGVLNEVLSRKLSQMTLQITQDCNFRCTYCIYSEKRNERQRSHSSKVMSWETAKQAVDFFWEHTIDNDGVNIGFYGGEPLLQSGLVKRIMEYAKKRFAGKILTFSMTCNGSLLTEENVQFLEQNRVSLLVSLDGPKQIQDQNRVFADGRGTYDTVMKRLAAIKQKYPEYWDKIHYSMVLDPKNDFDEINEICSNDTINPAQITVSLVDNDYDGTPLVFSEDYVWKEEYQRFLSFLALWGRYPKEKCTPLTMRSIDQLQDEKEKIDFAAPLHMTDIPAGPCVPGKLRLFVDAEGNLYPCERVSEKSPAMRIGTLAGGFDLDKAEKILQVAELTKDTCRNCWCFRFCDQCAKKADCLEEQLSAAERLRCCTDTRYTAERTMKDVLLLREVKEYYKEQIRTEKEGK
ncbi:MAG: radical SAM protein [Clostridium sp.]|nr:radical SAM protein [Clostridium sp.]